MAEPLVSIIIPVYNGEKTIKRAIDSCLKQDYLNIEVLVLDNQSNDNTKNVVLTIQSDLVKYIYLNQKGRSLARNEGIKRAKGNYVQFLDADDTLEATKISKSIELFENNPAIDAVSTGIQYDNGGSNVKTLFPEFNYPYEIIAHNIFPIHSLLLKKECATTFPEKLDYCEDWVFWATSLVDKTIYFDKSLIGGTVFIHDENTMLQNKLMREYELYVQQYLKGKYKKYSLPLKKNEISLLIIHYFNDSKEQITINEIRKQSAITYFFIGVFCRLPIIKTKLQNKIKEINQKDVYTEGE
ncbi:glycosyltransferase family 2 protein [Carnobacterium gallinarum]|uniref:glycosyltransferase family 2 protein n=1 Tax=Carnobacterium gallinarum TaxID=2749 RepID=UPI00068C45FA|nr:glycosyltransferase family 2 protein [Carnobacterium gallinarum]